jgi:hypothetical protein
LSKQLLIFCAFILGRTLQEYEALPVILVDIAVNPETHRLIRPGIRQFPEMAVKAVILFGAFSGAVLYLLIRLIANKIEHWRQIFQRR